MKCKVCSDEINLTIFGMPDDICLGCAQKDQKEEVLISNINIKKDSVACE